MLHKMNIGALVLAVTYCVAGGPALAQNEPAPVISIPISADAEPDQMPAATDPATVESAPAPVEQAPAQLQTAPIDTGPTEILKVKTLGDVSYVSGGVGDSEQQALKQTKADYNLWISFAVSGSGAFLSGVPVTVADQSGQVVLDAVSAGPYLYARVPAGQYRVSAQRDGQAETKSVSVPAAGGVSADFRWAGE